MKIKGVALDAEGVMFDFERDGHHLAHRRTAQDLGVNLSAEEALTEIPNLVGGPGKLIAKQIIDLAERRGRSISWSVDEVYRMSNRHFAELFAEIENGTMPISFRPGLLEAIEAIEGLGLPVVVGSSTWPEQFWIYWERTGLIEFFPRGKVILADESAGIRHKPEPDIFLKTAELMGIDPQEQLVFEDSQRGIQAGKAAGSTVIGVTVYDLPREMVRLYEAGASRVFCDWREMNVPALIENLNRKQV